MKILATVFLCAFFIGAGDPPAALLDHKWFFSYMRSEGKVQGLPLKVSDAKRPWIYFAKDGSYQQSMDGLTETGSWSYDEASKSLKTSVRTKVKEEVTKFLLRRVTADSLELKEPDGAVLGMTTH